MADTINSASDVEYNDDGTKNPDYIDPNAGTESANTDTENKGEGDDKSPDGDDEDFNDTIDESKPPEIPVRNSAIQHILARKDKKIAKLKSKVDDDGGDGDDDGSDDDSPLNDDAQEAINKQVSKAVAPLIDKIASEADEKELKDLVSAEPDAAKYLNHIKAYRGHEAYKAVPASVIYHHLAFKKAAQIGAKKKEAADLEAGQSKGGGRNTTVDTTNSGDFPSPQEISEMSEADFAKMEEDALQGKYLKK